MNSTALSISWSPIRLTSLTVQSWNPKWLEHDPPHALFGGADGMAVIDPSWSLAARLLREGGLCAVEHDDTTSDRTVDAFTRAGRSSKSPHDTTSPVGPGS